MTYRDIASYVEVRTPENTLNVSYKVQCIEDYLNLYSSAIVTSFKDLDSDSITRRISQSDQTGHINVNHFMELLGQMYVPYNHDLDSIIRITENNILDVVYSMAQAPIYTLINPVTQDSYVRESRATLNYGKNQSIIVGDAMDGRYHTFLQIDITPYINLPESFLISGELVLNISGAYDPSQIIDAYLVNTSWTETNITWNSAKTFDIDSSPLFSFKCTKQEVRIKLLDYLNELKELNQTSINLCLRARDENTVNLFNFFSKDSSMINYQPRIEVLYQDLVWTAFIGKHNLDCEVIIIGHDSRELFTTTIARQQDWGKFFLLSSALVGRWVEDFQLDSSATIQGNSGLTLEGSVGVNQNLNLESSAILQNLEDSDLEGSATVIYNSDLEADSEIVPTINLIGSANIRGLVGGNKDLSSSATIIYNAVLDSDSDIRKVLNLVSSATIRQHNDMSSSADIWYLADMISDSVTRRRVDNDTLNGESNIMTGADAWRQIDGNVTIRPQKQIVSLANVYMPYDITSTANIVKNKDLASSSIIVRSIELDGSVDTNSNSNLQSEAIVRLFDSLDIDSDISWINPTCDMWGTVMAGMWIYEMDSEAIVSLIRSKDVNGQANIWFYNLLDSQATIRPMKNLIGNAIIRQNINLDGIAEIMQNSNLAGNAIIRTKGRLDLSGDSIIRQFDINELDSEVLALGVYPVWLYGDAIVQKIGRDFINCNVTVRSTARKWIPNIHGIDKFEYENRKLPRVWTREQYIP